MHHFPTRQNYNAISTGKNGFLSPAVGIQILHVSASAYPTLYYNLSTDSKEGQMTRMRLSFFLPSEYVIFYEASRKEQFE